MFRIVSFLLLLAGPLAAQQSSLDSVFIDSRLGWARGLIVDTLIPMSGQHPGAVVVWPSSAMPNRRGEHKHGSHVAVVGARDAFALLHEFGHHYAVSRPQDYMDWAAEFKLDPWAASTFETFADVFVGAFELLKRDSARGRDREVWLSHRLRARSPFLVAVN